MATPPRVFDLNRPYFVSTPTHERRLIFKDGANANLLVDVLYQTSKRYEFRLLSFVVMPDHLHVIVVPRPGDTISQVMRFIKGTYARRHNDRVTKYGPVWQRSFHDRAIRGENDLFRFVQYIEDNPVKAGIVPKSEEYPYCSSNPKLTTDLIPYLTGQG
jgi:REP element-mobilizing transposase RayT